jgi:hypothetical protein
MCGETLLVEGCSLVAWELHAALMQCMQGCVRHDAGGNLLLLERTLTW